jgi:hypothetical protein
MALWYLDRYPQNLGYVLIEEKWDLLSSMEAPADWLIIGDSSGNQGVVPETLEEKLGGTAVNLCTVGNMALLDDTWMLRRYIDRFGPPENVVIVHVYNIWHREAPPPALLAQIPLPWGFWKEMSPPLELSLEERIDILLARYVPLIAEPRALKQALKSPTKLFKRKTLEFETNGYMPVSQANAGAVQMDAVAHRRFAAENEFTLSNINQRALNEIVGLANRYGINVYLANSPLYEDMLKDGQFREYYAAVEDWLRESAERSAHIHFLAGTVTFGMDQMDRVDHVTHSTALSFTHSLAARIADTRGTRTCC